MNILQIVGLAVTIIIALGGTAANLFLMGRFVGQWGEAMRNLTKMANDNTHLIQAVEDVANTNASKIALLDQRVVATEVVSQRFWEMREEFISMKTEAAIESRHVRESLESIKRIMSGMERQISNIFTTKSRIIELESENKN